MKLIFDIGGNVGHFTDKCLLRYPSSQLITIEPNELLFKFLVEKYQDKNVKILDYLVSSKNDEEIDFFISNADTISTASLDWINNSRFSNDYRWGSAIKKKTINIDRLIEIYGEPDLIKIDVEGYELEVIKGLSKKQNKLCFEWAEEEYNKINETCNYLKEIGYDNFGLIYGDEHLKEPVNYTTWEECEIHNDIDINRKEKWGMIWVK